MTRDRSGVHRLAPLYRLHLENGGSFLAAAKVCGSTAADLLAPPAAHAPSGHPLRGPHQRPHRHHRLQKKLQARTAHVVITADPACEAADRSRVLGKLRANFVRAPGVAA